MRIDWIEDLIALLDNGSVAEAAAARHISQSAFSRRIQALETLLGTPLIDRTAKPSLPTAALRNHEEQLRLVALQQRSLIKRMQTEGRSGSQLIVIACQHAITTSLGPGIVKLAAQIGKTHVRLRSANRDACEALLLTRQADFSITYRIASDAAARSEALTDKVVIAAEKLIPVFRAERANEALWRFHNGDLDVIAYPSDVFLGMSMARHIVPTIESRCRLNVVAETALTSAALQLASAGIGVAWVPLALARDDLRYGRVRDLSEHLESLDMQIVVERRPEGAVGPQDRLWQRFTQGFEQAEAPVQAA